MPIVQSVPRPQDSVWFRRLSLLTPSLQPLVPVAGALFLSAPDPFAAAAAVEAWLRGEPVDDGQLALLGVPTNLLAEYVGLLDVDDEERPLLLQCGAAWAMGMRSSPVPKYGEWRAVVSGSDLGPPDFPNRTGETLVQLIMSARQTIRFAPAYFDAAAAQYLGHSIAAASERGVEVKVVIVDQLERDEAAAELEKIVAERGVIERLRVLRGEASDWFAHMKVLSVDASAAYVGSANSTISGLTTNFELGTLVRGQGVTVIEAFLDRIEGVIELAELDAAPKPSESY